MCCSATCRLLLPAYGAHWRCSYAQGPRPQLVGKGVWAWVKVGYCSSYHPCQEHKCMPGPAIRHVAVPVAIQVSKSTPQQPGKLQCMQSSWLVLEAGSSQR